MTPYGTNLPGEIQMAGERIIDDVPTNIGRAISDLRPKSGKPTPQSIWDIPNRFSAANRRVFNRYIGGRY